jgi:hypothetical protein
MKKYLLVLFLVVLIVPSVVFASWWNPLSWKIFSFLNKKEVVPQTQLINKEIEKEKKPLDIIETPQEQLNSKEVIPEINETKKVTPVTENKVTQPKKSLEPQIPAKDSSEIDCGRGRDNGVGKPQPEIDCFFNNMINNCKKSKIILGKEAGYHSDILISINQENNSCLISGKTPEGIITCKFPHYSDLDKVESLKATQQERFEAVFGIPMILSFSLQKKSPNCTMEER